MGSLKPRGTDSDLIGYIYMFAGEIYAEHGIIELPDFYIRPDNIGPLLAPSDVRVSTEVALTATRYFFYFQLWV